MKESDSELQVVINAEKPRKGCFEIRVNGKVLEPYIQGWSLLIIIIIIIFIIIIIIIIRH